ncbi:MAG: hypothetical protein WCK69_01050 [Candidatus Saccharibacteria bacterium]
MQCATDNPSTKIFRAKYLALMALVLVSLIMTLSAKPVSAGSLSIQPLRQELELKPGQAISSNILVRNTGREPATINISAESFGVINEDYDYSFTQSQDLAKWVRFDEQKATILPNQSFVFNFTISVPISAEPGGKYIAIFSTLSSQSSANINSIERVGQLIYLSVSGASSRTGSVIGPSVPKISFDSKLNWSLRIHNTGSAHFKSTITTKTSYWPFGSVRTENTEHLILPNTIRLIKNNTQLGKPIGLYKIQISAGMGDKPPEVQTHWVLYLPPFQFVLFVLAIISGCITISKIRSKKSIKT